MFTLTKLSTLAAVATLVVLGGYGLPARADELAQNLGPVGPHEPILTTFGNKRVIAFYEPDQGRCFVNAECMPRLRRSAALRHLPRPNGKAIPLPVRVADINTREHGSCGPLRVRLLSQACRRVRAVLRRSADLVGKRGEFNAR